MDENNKLENQETAPVTQEVAETPIPAEETVPAETAEPEEIVEPEAAAEPPKAPVDLAKKKKNALIRAGIAAVLALALLIGSNFGIVKLLVGPEEVPYVDGLKAGSYVSTGITAILDNYCEGYNRSGETTCRYAIIPEGERLVTVMFPERYYESAQTIMLDTFYLIIGQNTELTRYIYVEGTAETLSEEAQTMLYDWYDTNHAWLESLGLLPAVEDAAEVLSTTAIRVDSVGGRSVTAVYALTGAAALLLVYALVELIRALRMKEKPALPAEAEMPVDAAPAEEETAEVSVEENAEENAEDAAEEGGAEAAEENGEEEHHDEA